MDIDKFFKTEDVASHLASDEARLHLVTTDPRHLDPTLSSLHILRFRLVFDVWHDVEGGSTEVFAVYEKVEAAGTSCLVRHVTLKRGSFGTFDLTNGISIVDKSVAGTLLSEIEREYVNQTIPAIREGSEYCTNTDCVEVEWMFNRVKMQAGWSFRNKRMNKLQSKLLQTADRLLKEISK